MASRFHQFMLIMIMRKMEQKGYVVVAFHGKEKIYPGIKYNVPPFIKRHKPDLIGVDIKNKKICIGDAKTDLDLNSERTKEQITDFSKLRLKENWHSECIIAIPLKSEKKFTALLIKWGLDKKRNLGYILVPELLSK